MTAITEKEFNKIVSRDAKKLHKEYLSFGQYWPMETIKSEIVLKLKKQYKIIK